MTQEDIRALSATASAAINNTDSATSQDDKKAEDQEKQRFQAYNLKIKTPTEVQSEFSAELGFDPFDINQVAQHCESEPILNEHVTNLLELQQNMGSMLIERFEKNMEAFKKYIPEIYEQFYEYKPTETLEFICTSNGIPNLYFTERKEFFYKTFNPVELCNTQVDTVLEHCPFQQINYTLDLERLGQIHHRYLNEIVKFQSNKISAKASPLISNSMPIAILVGVGLGYHIGHLCERIEIGNLILIEPNTDLFFGSLHAFDWANLLEYINENHLGIYFMVGQDKKNVFEDLNAFYERHGRMLACFMWSMVHYRSKEIDEIADRLIEDYQRSYATLGFYDDHLFAVSHGIHHIMNKVHFMKRGNLKDEYTNIPICVIANGPSLSHDLPFLRKVQDKVFIFACGSAIETLYNAGIRPDFYGCTERLRVVSEHLSLLPDQDFIRGRILIAGDVVHPEVTKLFDHTAVFGKADENFFWLALSRLYSQFKQVATVSLMNPLVGNLGVSATTQMGFKNIYFFGTDNGTKREDMMTHPDESLYYNKIVVERRKKQEEEEKNAAAKELDGIENLEKEATVTIDESQKDESKDTTTETKNDTKSSAKDDAATKKKDEKEEAKRAEKIKNASLSGLEYTLEGNFGGEVYTSYIYKLSASYMNVIIRHGINDKKLNYFNCSDGAKLEGAIPVHSENLNWFLDLPDIDRKKFIDYIDNEKTMEIKLTDANIRDMVSPEIIYHMIDLILKILKKEERPTNRIEYVLMLQTTCELVHQLSNTRDKYAADFFDGSLDCFFAMLLRTLYLIKDEEEAIKYTEEQIKYIEYFLDDVKRLYKFLPNYCAEDHQIHLHGKIGYDHPDSPAPDLRIRDPLVTQEDRDNYPTRKFVKRYE